MSFTKDILVVGGHGRLGRALTGYGCQGVGRDTLDITNVQSIDRAIGQFAPKLMINCAAYTDVDKAESDQEKAFAINRDGAANLATACARADLPLIHISTDCVFGDGDPDRPVNEDDAPSPLSVYGQSKYDGEEAVRKSAARSVIVRVSWLFDSAPGTFIAKMLDLAKARDALRIVDDAYGRPTPTQDAAALLIKLAERMIDGMPVPHVLHIGPQNPVSRYEWAEFIFAVSKEFDGPAPSITSCSAEDFKETARRPRGLVLDIASGNALLGLMPDWQEACRQTVHDLLA